MAGYRKLGRTSSQRKALLRIQATNLLYHGKIVTTEARAKEVRKIVESLIALAVKEKDNFETVKVTAKVARKKLLTVRKLLYTTKLRRKSRRTCRPDFMQEDRW